MSKYEVAADIANAIKPAPGDKEARRLQLWVIWSCAFAPIGLILSLFANFRYEAVNDAIMNENWHLFFGTFAVVASLFLWTNRRKIHPDQVLLTTLLALFFSCGVMFFGLFHLTNGLFDTSAPRTVEAVITEAAPPYKSEARIYFNHWDDPYRRIKKWVPASKARSAQINKTHIAAKVKKGFWGFEFYVKGSFKVL